MNNTTELEIVRSAVSLPGAAITRTALIIDPNASDEQWEHIRQTLKGIQGSHSWWIGDYGVALQARKGEHYTDAHADDLGVERNTFKQYKSLAAFINPSNRLDDLSFTHHLEAMYGSDGDQSVMLTWLASARENKWSVSQLRKAIRINSADYKADGLRPTGNGYSALTDADRWAGAQMADADAYSPEQAAAILSDMERLLAFVDMLRAKSRGIAA